jgi:BASS family bile acid:Na+ symporter
MSCAVTDCPRVQPTTSGAGRTADALLARASRFLSEWLLVLMLLAYALAAWLPGGGLWAREVRFGELGFLGERACVTLSTALLALMLFSAGLGIPLAQVCRLVRGPALLLAGLLANLTVPVLYIAAASLVLRAWFDAGQVLLGLALVASMPIATSSAAWSQTGNGNLALTLGLILVSTLLSPLTTPMVLHSVDWVTVGEIADGLNALTGSGMSVFLILFVLVPSVLGVAARRLIGDRLVTRAWPGLKLLSGVILLVLNYTNASASLPGLVAQPAWDFLGLALVVAGGMCALTFATGWAVGTLLRADKGRRTAVMFGLGLNNNGAALVLASVALAGLPEAMLVAVLYTLIQHVIAGIVNRLNQP